MSKYQTEILRRVYDNEEGRFITVGPSPDFPEGNVCLMVEKGEQDYWGELRLDQPAEFMRKLGEALIAAANEASSA